MRDAYVPLVKAGVIASRTKGQPTALIDPALGKSIKDFLPRFASGLSSPTNKKGVVGIEFNTLPFSAPVAGHGRIQLSGMLHDPEPYKALIQAVSADRRAAATKEVSDRFREIDDVDVSVGWNVETANYGRSFSAHRPALQEILEANSLGDEAPTLLLPPLYRAFIEKRRAGSQCTDLSKMEQWVLACATEPFLAVVRTTVRESARAAALQEAAVRVDLDASGLFTIPFLINNQPQVHFNFGYRHANEMVGPKQAYGELTYEFGNYNMNDLRQYCVAPGHITIAANCLIEYLGRPEVRAGLRNASRFALTIGTTRYLKYDAALPAYAVSLSEPASWQFRVKAAWGRFFGVPDEGTTAAAGRLETSLEYVNHTNSSLRKNNRMIGSISYSHRVNDAVTLTTGFVAANTSELRGDVNWPISALAGFKYKLSGADSK
jgi:hypothetical protein